MKIQQTPPSPTVSQDKRQFLRRDCFLPLLDPNRVHPIGNVLNLSTEGLYIETEKSNIENLGYKGKLQFLEDHNPIEFFGKVVHLQNMEKSNQTGMGIHFQEINSTNRKKIKTYVLNHGFTETLKEFQKHSSLVSENLKPFGKKKGILSIFQSAITQEAEGHIFWCKQEVWIPYSVQEINPFSIFINILKGEIKNPIKKYAPLYLALKLQDEHLFYEASVKNMNGETFEITVPSTLYFEEKRVESRKTISPENPRKKIFVDFLRMDTLKPSFLEIVDFNSSGFSVHLDSRNKNIFSTDPTLYEAQLTQENKILKKGEVKITHTTKMTPDQWKVGFNFRLLRTPYQFLKIQIKPQRKSLVPPPLSYIGKALIDLTARIGNFGEKTLTQYQRVTYSNLNNEKIVGILNTTRINPQGGGKINCPVVIIPPAYARRKETTGLLALTIAENFKKRGEEIAILRYDGIRTIGESHNDEDCKKDRAEMLNFTLSQGIKDLSTTLEYINSKNSPVSPSQILLISFSNASVIARKVILLNKFLNITCWINVMGITDPQDLILNATCGIDYIDQYENGDTLGTFELLGHQVKKNILEDVLTNKMARLENARVDIAAINFPIIWIYGKYDYWTNQRRIKDVMSLKSKGKRVLIEVPTGHILRSGKEALLVFNLITEKIWEQCFGFPIKSSSPNRIRATKFTQQEWRNIKNQSIESKVYWKEYMLGKKKESLGFDILSFTNEYQEMMEKQVDLLDIKSDDLICDMGGGTGNLTQTFFRTKEQTFPKAPLLNLNIVQVDLIPEILKRSKEKHRQLINELPLSSLFLKVKYIGADLNVEQNKNLPFSDSCFSKVIGSLLISYLNKPVKTVQEFYRILKPGGKLILSTLKPDADMSKAFHDLAEKINLGDRPIEGYSKEALLESAQEYINSTSYLSDLEEEGVFKFYNEEELFNLIKKGSFKQIEVFETGGNPPKILIGIGHK